MEKKNPQTEANKRWQEKNKDRTKYLSDRSRAKSFIKNRAKLEDLAELEHLIFDSLEKIISNEEDIQKLKYIRLALAELEYKYRKKSEETSNKNISSEEAEENIINYIKEHPEEADIHLLKILNEIRENK